MSGLGNWLYYKKKFKLFLLPGLGLPSKHKTILALTYQHNWELPEGWQVNYFDINSGITIVRPPDLVIEREFNDGKAEYSLLYDHNLKHISPKIFWFIDAHVSDIERIRYCDHFDFVFVAQSPYINFVKSITSCKNIFWLPLCFPNPDAEIAGNVQLKKYPVSFIGKFGDGYNTRNEMINFLQNEYRDKFFAITDYHDPKKLIQQSKITTNQSLKDDLNFRVFETLGYGTELVTNHVPDLEKIEGLKERVHCFSDTAELKKKIDRLLLNSSQEKDTIEAQAWVKKNHTMKKRLAEMLEMINTGKQVEYK